MLAAKNAENAENWGFAPDPKSFATFAYFAAKEFTKHKTPRKEQPANEQ